jgi:hypothetical protein
VDPLSGGRDTHSQLAPGEPAKVGAELVAYREFAALSEQVVEVNEAICEARPVTSPAEQSLAGQAGERGALPGARHGGSGQGRAAGRRGGPFAAHWRQRRLL